MKKECPWHLFHLLLQEEYIRMWKDENSKRPKENKVAKTKYDGSEDIDLPIVKIIKEVADKLKVTMAQVSMAWLLAQKNVASPVFDALKSNK